MNIIFREAPGPSGETCFNVSYPRDGIGTLTVDCSDRTGFLSALYDGDIYVIEDNECVSGEY